MWNNFYYNTGTGGDGPITIVNLTKDVEMEVSAEQNRVNMEVEVEKRTSFEVAAEEINIKFDATWQRN